MFVEVWDRRDLVGSIVSVFVCGVRSRGVEYVVVCVVWSETGKGRGVEMLIIGSIAVPVWALVFG